MILTLNNARAALDVIESSKTKTSELISLKIGFDQGNESCRLVMAFDHVNIFADGKAENYENLSDFKEAYGL